MNLDPLLISFSQSFFFFYLKNDMVIMFWAGIFVHAHNLDIFSA